jgi:predicted Zn-dependent peptidase
LKVIVAPDDESPLVLAAMGLLNGPFSEPEPGTTNLALNMLRKGTQRHDAEELAALIEQRALKVQAVTVMDGAMLAVSGLTETRGECLDLLAELVTTATFPRKELRMLKRRERVMLRYAKTDPAYRADLELRQRLFDDRPYARPVTGGPKDVKRLSGRDLTAWWTAVARPDAAVLYLAGDVDVEEAFRCAEQAFGTWKAADGVAAPPLPDTPEPRTLEPTHVYLVDVSRAVQSQIRIGQVSLGPEDPDYFAARVFSEVYGGSFSSRLNMALRGEQGRTYGAFGGFTFQKHAGYLSSSVSTETKQTAEALESMLEVLEGMRKAAPSPDELRRAQGHLIGSAILRLETFVDAVNFLWYLEYMGFPPDHLATALEAYAAVEPEDIQQVAGKHIDPDRLTVVVVGDDEAAEAQLEAFGPVTSVK